MNHFLFMVLRKKANFLTSHHLIRCKLLVTLHPSAFEPLYILGSNRLNHNFKVFITLHLHLHVGRDEPHTACTHVNKFKNVVRG